MLFRSQFTVGLNGKRSRSGRDFPVPFSTLISRQKVETCLVKIAVRPCSPDCRCSSPGAVNAPRFLQMVKHKGDLFGTQSCLFVAVSGSIRSAGHQKLGGFRVPSKFIFHEKKCTCYGWTLPFHLSFVTIQYTRAQPRCEIHSF